MIKTINQIGINQLNSSIKDMRRSVSSLEKLVKDHDYDIIYEGSMMALIKEIARELDQMEETMYVDINDHNPRSHEQV